MCVCGGEEEQKGEGERGGGSPPVVLLRLKISMLEGETIRLMYSRVSSSIWNYSCFLHQNIIPGFLQYGFKNSHCLVLFVGFLAEKYSRSSHSIVIAMFPFALLFLSLRDTPLLLKGTVSPV